MKLGIIDNREPEQIRVTVSAATFDKLKAYTEFNPGFIDVRQLAAEILRAFAEKGDKDFSQWYKTQEKQPVTVKPELKKPKKEKQSSGVNGVGQVPQNLAAGE